MKYPCNLTDGAEAALADVFREDRRVNTRDIGGVAAKFGTSIGDPNYDWYFDLNTDLCINGTDIDIVTSQNGKYLEYLNDTSFGFSSITLRFSTGQNVSLDRDGFAYVPSGATWFFMSVGGVIEFFDAVLMQNVSTSNLGAVSVGWRPSENGVYLTKTGLPSSFDAVVTFNSNVTQVESPLTIADYYYVVKRPVSLTTDMLGEFNITSAEAEADAYVSEADSSGWFGNETALYISGGPSYSEKKSYIRFNLSSIPVGAYICSARLDLRFAQTFGTDNFDINLLDSNWSELNVTWNTYVAWRPDPKYVVARPDSGLSFIDLTEFVRMWSNSSAINYGIVLKPQGNSCIQFVAHSREAAFSPKLEISYIVPSPVIVADAYDNVTQESISSLPIQLSADGLQIEEASTNSSGTATFSSWRPTTNTVQNVSVLTVENGTYRVSGTYVLYDFRYSTNVTSLDGNPRNVTIEVPYDYHFSLRSSSLVGLKGQTVKFLVNGTSTDGTQYSGEGTNNTDINGNVQFAWGAEQGGVYSMRAVFEGNETYKACETYVTINASVTPFGLLFEVTPTEFEPGASLFLNATIMDPFTGRKVTGGVRMNVTFFRLGSDGSNVTIARIMTGTGEATKGTTYPNNNKTYAYVARLDSVFQDGQVPQGVVSNPVQLTVSNSSRILLGIIHDDSSVWHTVYGYLKYNSTGIPNRLVKVKVNSTEFTRLTDINGYFNLQWYFNPYGNLSTYIITATFEGDSGSNVTAWANTPEGTPYPACTTIQYAYKPSINATTLTVDPRAAQLMRMIRSPEEMQKEARNKGWLNIWHEWTWWYPWYKLHVEVNINPHIHVAFSPILPGGEIQTFTPDVPELIRNVAIDVLVEYFISEGIYRFMRNTGNIVAGIVAFIGTTIANFVLLGMQWNSLEGLRATAISSFVSAFIGSRGPLDKLSDAISCLIDWFGTFCTEVKRLSVTFISLVGVILDGLDVIFNLIICGISIGRLIELGGLYV